MARGRFRSLSVSETVYQKLKEIAGRRGFSTLADTVAYLVSLEELVVSKLESITIATSAGNVASQGITQGKAELGGEEGHADEGYEWCWSKTKVGSLQSFIKWVDERFGLLGWRDEGDRHCFKTKKKPAKTE